MPVYLRCPLCLLVLLAVTACTFAQQGGSVPAQTNQTLVLGALGRGTVDVTGLWQFHTGDNSAWSRPGYDDSTWENITADAQWGAPGHPSYAGFAWYRKHIDIVSSAGINKAFKLLIPAAEDSYEVF